MNQCLFVLQNTFHIGAEDRLWDQQDIVVVGSAADIFIEMSHSEITLLQRILIDRCADLSVLHKLLCIGKEIGRNDLWMPVVGEDVAADAVCDRGGDVNALRTGGIGEDVVDLFFCEGLGVSVFVDADLGEGVSGEILKSVHLAFVDGVGKAAC